MAGQQIAGNGKHIQGLFSVNAVTIFSLSNLSFRVISLGQVPGAAPIPIAPGAGVLQRHEVENILAASRELVSATREIK